jgi:hypothetical protein
MRPDFNTLLPEFDAVAFPPPGPLPLRTQRNSADASATLVRLSSFMYGFPITLELGETVGKDVDGRE